MKWTQDTKLWAAIYITTSGGTLFGLWDSVSRLESFGWAVFFAALWGLSLSFVSMMFLRIRPSSSIFAEAAE